MFESAALGRSYPAKEYAALENDLRMKLFKAQGTCIEHKLLGWLVWWHHQAFLLRRYRREGVQCVDGTLEEA